MIKKFALVLLFVAVSVCFLSVSNSVVKADDLSNNIEEQLNNLDLSELEEYINNISNQPAEFDFALNVRKLLNGEYDSSYLNFPQYVLNVLLDNIFSAMPTFLSILAIAIFCGIMQSIKSGFVSEGVSDMVFFVCFLSIILLISSEVIAIWKTTQITIKNMAKLSEIMSPIILTLMIASGGNVSASVYKPAVAFLSNGVLNVIMTIVLPLIGVMSIFAIISHFSQSVKLTKFSELATSIIKWIMGLIIAIFGLFLSVQGITSATFDGISIKAAKYALSNSVPIIGGFLGSGFDLMIAGSVLIKNAIGVVSIVGLLYLILSPVLYMVAFSLLLKLTAAVTEPITDQRLSNFCATVSKCITYMIVCVIIVGFMLFITVLLMIFSANAFI